MAQDANIEIRDFDMDKDMTALQRIWREIGWSDSERVDQAMTTFYSEGSCSVAVIKGTAQDRPVGSDSVECAVHAISGTKRLEETDLPLCVIAAVTTSRVARGLSLAQKLTARELAKARDRGAAVAVLGMFDQGFYDKVGFGTGAYMNEFRFDPSTLKVDLQPRAPKRLSPDDFESMLAALIARPRLHGAVVIQHPKCLQAELAMEDGFGLGYYTNDRLTHFVWMVPKGEHGPYKVKWMGYEDGHGLLELLALLKSLGDQVYSVHMVEPPHVQLQSMLKRPFRGQAIAEEGNYSAEQNTCAWYQLRVLDPAACVQALSYQGPELSFRLRLQDPLDSLLASDQGWQPISGSYEVTLGQHSSFVTATGESAQPVLSCSVNTFSRLIWGVAPASSLAISDGLQGPPELLTALDRVFRPNPNPGWDF